MPRLDDYIIDSLAALVRDTIAQYNQVIYWREQGFFLKDTEKQIYTIITVPDETHPTERKPSITISVRLLDNLIVIDEDITDRPLYQELLRAGIPREQMILRYAGETLPEHLQPTPESE